MKGSKLEGCWYNPSVLQTTRLWSHTHCGLQRIMDALQQTSEKYNMRINVKKTKVMRMPGRKGRKLRIVVNSKELESVTQFCYLGSMVTEDCRCECEVRRRIALTKEAFNKKKELMCGSLSLQLKKRIYKAFVWSIALYGSETWTLQKSDIKRIEAFEM